MSEKFSNSALQLLFSPDIPGLVTRHKVSYPKQLLGNKASITSKIDNTEFTSS